MKISDLFLEPDFFTFPKHKAWWGVRYAGQSNFTPTLYS